MLIPHCVTVVTLLLSCGAPAADDSPIDDSFRPALPVIADREIRLARPADDPSGKVATSLFADAIDELHQRGGERLVVPPGIWKSGPIHLKSGVELHLEEDAEIRFSTQRTDLFP